MSLLGVAAGTVPGRKGNALRSYTDTLYILQATGLIASAAIATTVLISGRPLGAQFTPGLGVTFGMDPLSACFSLLIALIGLPALLYAKGHLHKSSNERPVILLTGLFLVAMLGVVTARDAGSFLLCWELMTIVPASTILLAGHGATARRAIFVYLALTHLGGAAVWVLLLWLSQLGALGHPEVLATQGIFVQTTVAVLALIGFGTKAGLMPIHTWLPRAHPLAPTHISALMSGVMIKVALYGLIRVFFFFWAGTSPLGPGLALIIAGAISALGGVLYALMQHDLKRLLAFHSIENVGIIVLGLGASLLLSDAHQSLWAALAFAAAMLHTLNHAVFKALLFLGAGAIGHATGELRLEHLGGLLKLMPQTGAAFFVAAVAISGLPPLNGFASEWLTLQALIHAAITAPLAIALPAALAVCSLAMAAALAVYCFVKVIGIVLLGTPRSENVAAAKEATPLERTATGTLAILCVALGLLPGFLIPLFMKSAGFTQTTSLQPGFSINGTGSLPTLTIGVVLAALIALLAYAKRTRRAAPAPVWVCGQDATTPQLRWSATGFSKPLRLVLTSLLPVHRSTRRQHAHGIVQSVYSHGEFHDWFDQSIYEPSLLVMLRGAARIRRLHSGSLRTYVGYLLATVMTLALLLRVGVFQ